ncbi:MAG: glycosyltransferase, partial [Devosia sp.]|nr:glycosyltransferase [Devosia sp.]
TKPRACNYALPLCRGEFVVIFDAEDRPEADQLREAVRAFRANDFTREHLDRTAKPLHVVQAGLSYFNADYNVLTRMFANEYAFWFDGMLPGLDELGIPIPLGGTSNHFRIEPLRELDGWDPYNVTEDADLGIRVATHGGKVGVIHSTTWEEACADAGAWIRQRTRWIKGYMVTAAVNSRHPFAWVRRHGLGAAVTLFALILSTPLAFLAYPLILAFTVITYVGVSMQALNMPEWIFQVGLINMLAGNVIMIVATAIAAWRRYGWRIAVFAPLNPISWLMHSFAAWRAAWQMYFEPHRWEKTPHGISEDYESELVTLPR